MRRIASALAAVTLAAVLAGCGTDAAPTPTAPEDFAAQALSARDDAAQAGASEAQLAILDEVAATGEVTMEQELAARDAFAQCLSAAGFRLEDLGVSNEQGYPYPDYRITVPADGGDDALMDACEGTHFLYVDMLYQTQPSSRQAGDDQFAKAMPDLIACLNEGGLEVDPDVTADELKSIMLDDLRSKVDEDPETANDLVGGCMAQVGINGF